MLLRPSLTVRLNTHATIVTAVRVRAGASCARPRSRPWGMSAFRANLSTQRSIAPPRTLPRVESRWVQDFHPRLAVVASRCP
jgi:hypothetical protein